MSTASVQSQTIEPEVVSATGRVADYVQLVKPRIATMAMVAVTVGFLVGTRGEFRIGDLLSACFGILCIAASCNFLNQWYEQDTDQRMRRTADRPVAAGRIRANEVFIVGLAVASFGCLWLWLTVNVMTCVLSSLTLAIYVCAYTPLKRVSCLCTVLGAVAGAMPPVLGWAAAGGALDAGAAALFLLLFAWQFPHFLAIATIYRDDYEAADLKMLPLLSGRRNCAGVVGVVYACALIPISLLVWDSGLAGNLYVVVAMTGGVVYLISSVRFMFEQSVSRARELVLCSIVYLPAVLLTMTWDHFRLLS